MCEIDNARPKIENLQPAEKSRGRLGYWRFSDQKNRSDESRLMRKIRTIETNEKFRENSKNYRKKIRKVLKIDIADDINY